MSSRLGRIRLNHFQGKEVDISYALSSLASQENCDSEEYELMYRASNYIKYLESITAVKFSDAIRNNELDEWVNSAFCDESQEEIRETGTLIREGARLFMKIRS